MSSSTSVQSFDTIVVGGGHNTLIAAGYLAKAGHKVLVLEKNPYIGGGAVTQEVTLPGFRHELHAIGMSWIRVNPLLSCDELGLYARHGLEVVDAEGPAFSSLFDDGNSLSTYFEVDKTCAEIARYSARDAETYRELTRKNVKLLNIVNRCMFSPPIGLGAMFRLMADSEDGRYLTRLMFSSASDVIERLFENSHVRCHLYKWISESNLSPDEVGTGIFMLILLGMGHVQRLGVFKGGNHALPEALRRAIESYGGEVRISAQVEKFNVSGGKITGVTLASGETLHARKAVVAATPPWDLHKFIDGLDKRRLGDIDGLRHSGYGTFVVHYALKEAPRFRNASDEFHRTFATECMVNDLERFRRCYDGFKYGEMPEFFSGHSVCPTMIDPSRAPAGKHTLYFYHYVPLIPNGKHFDDWSSIKHDFADWMLEGFQCYTLNMDSSNILGRCVESPYDMQLHSPSFRNGDVFGLAMGPRQFMGERPTPELAQYRVPGVEGLYLCGPAQHPGGGVIGVGRPVAMRILMDQKMDIYSIFNGI